MNTDGSDGPRAQLAPRDWVVSHSTFDGTLNDNGGNVEGTDPGFVDFPAGDLSPAPDSSLDRRRRSAPRRRPFRIMSQSGSTFRTNPRRRGPTTDAPDLGAFEAGLIFADGFESGDLAPWSAIEPRP